MSGLTGTGLLLFNGADQVTVPPEATSFTFPTTVSQGTPYSVTIQHQPSAPLQQCVLSNADGTAGVSANVVSVACTTTTELVIVDAVYPIDPATGALGAPTSTLSDSGWVSSDPLGSFVYVALPSTSLLNLYSVDHATGRLSQPSTSSAGTGFAYGAMSFTPDGKYAYVAVEDGFEFASGFVAGFSIDSSTGSPSPLSGNPFFAGAGPAAVATRPDGKFLYAANFIDATVSAFALDPVTGAPSLIAGGTYSTEDAPTFVAVDPAGRFLYVVDFNNDSASAGFISAYSIDESTGGLSPVPGSPFTTGVRPDSISIDPSGRFAYVSNLVDGNVSAYSIDGTSGALSPIPGSPFAAGTQPVSVAVDKTGKYAYVPNSGSSNISAFAIDQSSGALTPVPGSPFSVGSGRIPSTPGLTAAFIQLP